MKRTVAFILTASLLCSCAGLNIATVGSDLISDVTQGSVVATDAYAAYQSINQNLTTANVIQGKLDPAKVLAGAQAITQTLNGPATASLTTAVNSFVADVNGQIAALKSQGVTSPAAITSNISASGAATVSTIAAVPTSK
jgi:hypothetical protein